MASLWRVAPTIVLLSGCAMIWNARSQSAVPLAAPLQTVLATLPGYRAQDQQLSDEERRVAGMTSYVARAYWQDSLPVFTTFVSYYARQTQGQTIHSPRNCLPGAGWEVLTQGVEQVVVDGHSYTLNRSLLKNGPSVAVVYYWYQGRGRIVADEYQVKWNLLRDATLRGHTEEALVRVVVPVRPAPAGPDRDRFVADASRLGAQVSARLTQEVARVLPKA
jgi:EpsI family protein